MSVLKINDTQPPTIGNANVTSSSKWDNVFVKNKDGDTISLDEKADDIAEEVSRASPTDLLQRLLVSNLALLLAVVDHGELATSAEDYLNTADDMTRRII